MLYLFWSILNIGLFLWFAYLLIKAVGFIRSEFGLFQCVVFVFGLLATCNSNESNKKNNELEKFDINDRPKTAPTESILTTVDNNMLFNIELSVLLTKDTSRKEILPIEASSFLSGFHSGIEWKATSISVDTVGKDLQYRIFGTLEWKLLAATIVSQGKEYNGLIAIK